MIKNIPCASNFDFSKRKQVYLDIRFRNSIENTNYFWRKKNSLGEIFRSSKAFDRINKKNEVIIMRLNEKSSSKPKIYHVT